MRCFPAISRGYDAHRKTLLIAGDNGTNYRLVCTFDVVSAYYWSTVEPANRPDDEAGEDAAAFGHLPAGDMRTFSAENIDRILVKAPGPVTSPHA